MNRLSILVIVFLLTFYAGNIGNCSHPLRVGVVLSIGGLFDRSFNDATYVGIQKLRQTSNCLVDVLEPSNTSEIEAGIEYFSSRKFDLIVGVGIFSNEPIRLAASKHPDQAYTILDSVVTAPNVLSILFNEEEGSFYAGALAGLLTKTNKVGFLGGMISPIISTFERGFRNGLGFVNPGAKLVVRYAGETPEAFNAPEVGKKLGEDLIRASVDIAYHASGRTGLGLIEASRHNNLKIIGVDSDQSTIAPGRIVASMVKRLDIALDKAARSVREGRFKGCVLTLGLADGGVDLVFSRFNRDLISPIIRERLDEVKGFLLHQTSTVSTAIPPVGD